MFSIMNAARRSTHWSIAAAALIAPAVHAQGRIQGTVHDSIAARPLDSAFVQLAYLADPSVSRSAVTDERGRFRVDSLRPGQWIISLMHPRIDSAGVSQLARQVQVQERAETRVQLALPSAKAITRQVCGRERVRATRAASCTGNSPTPAACAGVCEAGSVSSGSTPC
jgi:hypothetical protein